MTIQRSRRWKGSLTKYKKSILRRDSDPAFFYWWSIGGSRSLCSLKALGRPIRPSSPAHCSKVHRTFSQRSRPHGFDPLVVLQIEKRNGKSHSVFLMVEHRGITFALLTEGIRKAHSAFLARSLFEGPPDLLTTFAPSRVRSPRSTANRKTEWQKPFRLSNGGA